MKARTILAIHVGFTALVLALAFGGFAYVAMAGSPAAHGVLIANGTAFMLLMMVWRACGGCPFTSLEQRLLVKEGSASYTGPCLSHYARTWFKVPLGRISADALSVVILLLPAIGALYSLL